MARANGSRAPRASRLMTAVFHAIAACGDVVDHWDVAQRDDGVLLHVRSREQYPSETAATEAAGAIAGRIRPEAHTVRDLALGARSDGSSTPVWRAVVEVLVS